MDVLDVEIASYTKMRDYLEANHLGQWALVYGKDLIGVYDDFDEAARVAIRRFGRGPFLIREVGGPPVVLNIPTIAYPAYADC
jgi:hypothetical protein